MPKNWVLPVEGLYLIEKESVYRGSSKTVIGVCADPMLGRTTADAYHHKLHPHASGYPEDHPINRCCRARWEELDGAWKKKFTDDDVDYEYTVRKVGVFL